MKISMIYDTVRWEEKSIHKAAEQKGIELSMINVKEMDMDFDRPVPDSYGNVTLLYSSVQKSGRQATIAYHSV